MEMLFLRIRRGIARIRDRRTHFGCTQCRDNTRGQADVCMSPQTTPRPGNSWKSPEARRGPGTPVVAAEVAQDEVYLFK